MAINDELSNNLTIERNSNMMKKENTMEIRCLIKQDGDLYIAMSLDFGLSAQGSSVDEVKCKLEEQIEEYIVEACTVDKAHAEELLSRKGPINWFATFYLAKLHILSKKIFTFTEVKSTCPTHA